MNIENYRIHHIRPRFKNDIESVLAFMANEISNIGRESGIEFKKQMNNAIRFYPGNASLKEKTINNWRTEISALFGLILEYDNHIEPSKRNLALSSSGNLIEFFRNFLFYFQYPGGHLKPKEAMEMVRAGIKFKPAAYILKLLVYGTTQLEGKRFGLSKAEATHLIFNNLKVTRDQAPCEDIYDLVMKNRTEGFEYDQTGDVVRYAGDILDYLVLADLADCKIDNKYYPKMQNLHLIDEYLSDEGYFDGYDELYSKKEINIDDIKAQQLNWQMYSTQSNERLKYTIAPVGKLKSKEKSKEPTSSKRDIERASVAITEDIKARLEQVMNTSSTTLDIGNLGEAISIEHEKNRIKLAGGEDQIHKIQKIPEQYSMGFDIKSLSGIDGDFSQIFIEVKSTTSRNKLTAFSFNLTTNEFSSAKTHRGLYFIYRIFLTEEDISLFVINDPVSRAFREEIDLNLTSNGGQFKFSDQAGHWEKILI